MNALKELDEIGRRLLRMALEAAIDEISLSMDSMLPPDREDCTKKQLRRAEFWMGRQKLYGKLLTHLGGPTDELTCGEDLGNLIAENSARVARAARRKKRAA